MTEHQEVLAKLRSELLGLSAHARDGDTLIGLGTAINVLDCLSKKQPIETRVGLRIGFRQCGEGMDSCVNIDETGVQLSTRNSGVTTEYDFNWWDYSRWRGTLLEIINLGGRLAIWTEAVD